MTIINGKIPTSGLTALSVGGYLQANAAYWFEQWRIAAKKAGFDLTITSVADAYREYTIQERIFLQRYIPQKTGGGYYNDVRWFNGVRYVRKQGNAAAAIPGTSNHGRGLAIDIKNVGPEKGAFYQWLAATGPSYGFTNTEGRSVNELWHWVHDNRAVITPKPTLPNTSIPTPQTQEHADMFVISNDIPGHPQRGTAWVAVPQGNGKPRATTLYGGDKFGTAPVITIVNQVSWDNFIKSIAWA